MKVANFSIIKKKNVLDAAGDLRHKIKKEEVRAPTPKVRKGASLIASL